MKTFRHGVDIAKNAALRIHGEFLLMRQLAFGEQTPRCCASSLTPKELKAADYTDSADESRLSRLHPRNPRQFLSLKLAACGRLAGKNPTNSQLLCWLRLRIGV